MSPTGRHGTTGARVEMSTIWRIMVAIALVGVVVLAVLLLIWRSGRMPAVRTLPPSPGALVAHVGSIPGGGRSALADPRAVAVDDEHLYVVEPGLARISVFRLDGRFVRSFDVDADGTVYPVGIAVRGDRLYVVDTAGNRVLEMGRDGGPSTAVARTLRQPTAIAADGESLLVSDAVAGLVRFVPGSEAASPLGASTDAEAVFGGGIAPSRDRVFVTDTGGSRVLAIDRTQGQVAAFGERINLPRGIALDGAGRMWVADVLGGTVFAFDSMGTLLGDIEREAVSGVEAPRLSTPQGLAFASSVNRLYVVDEKAGRVLVYEVAQ